MLVFQLKSYLQTNTATILIATLEFKHSAFLLQVKGTESWAMMNMQEVVCTYESSRIGHL